MLKIKGSELIKLSKILASSMEFSPAALSASSWVSKDGLSSIPTVEVLNRYKSCLRRQHYINRRERWKTLCDDQECIQIWFCCSDHSSLSSCQDGIYCLKL